MEGLFAKDAEGRTPLFGAVLTGDRQLVERMIFGLMGTGLFPPRLALLNIQDNTGLTAADLAEQVGHTDISRLLRNEMSRMEYSE